MSLFILFLVLLGVVGTLVAVWAGPVASLALSGERRDAPYYVLALDRVDGPTALDRLVGEDEGGEVVYSGRLSHFLGGLVRRDEWQRVSVYRFGKGGDFLKLLTSKAFRDTRRGEGMRVILGSMDEPNLRSTDALAFWLVRHREHQILEASTVLVSTSERFQGRPAWNADLDVIEGDSEWQSVRVIAFPGEALAFDWHADLNTKTEVALMKARYADSAGLLLVGR